MELSWEERGEAVRLADMLQAAGVLQHRDGLLAGAAREGDWGGDPGDSGADRLASCLLLADGFQTQLPRAHAACLHPAGSQGVPHSGEPHPPADAGLGCVPAGRPAQQPGGR